MKVRRFDDFHARLGIGRPILADRLQKLVDNFVLTKVAYQTNPLRYEYRLTPKGLDLHPVIMSIVHWGDVHMAGKKGRPVLHRHLACDHHFDPILVCSHCGRSGVRARHGQRAGPGRRGAQARAGPPSGSAREGRERRGFGAARVQSRAPLARSHSSGIWRRAEPRQAPVCNTVKIGGEVSAQESSDLFIHQLPLGMTVGQLRLASLGEGDQLGSCVCPRPHLHPLLRQQGSQVPAKCGRIQCHAGRQLAVRRPGPTCSIWLSRLYCMAPSATCASARS